MRGARARGLNSGDGDSESRVLTITPRDLADTEISFLLPYLSFDKALVLVSS